MAVDSLPGIERTELADCKVGDYLLLVPDHPELSHHDDGENADWTSPDGVRRKFVMEELKHQPGEWDTIFVWLRVE